MLFDAVLTRQYSRLGALMDPVRQTLIFSREKKGGEAIRCEIPGAVNGRLLGGVH